MDALALGRYLRETREAQERTIEDAETALKIRRRVLEGFEMGEFEQPQLSTVQVRGFMRNYARYLGLDEDKVIGYYDAARAEALNPPKRSKREARKQAKQAPPPKRATNEVPVAARSVTDTDPTLPPVPETALTMGDAAELRRFRRRNTFSRFVLILMATAALSVIAFVSYELLQRPAGALEIAPLPDILVTETPTPTYTPIATATLQQEALAPQQRVPLTQVYDGIGVRVTILTQQRTWIDIKEDGNDFFTGIMSPDEVIEADGFESVSVTASNAEALLVTYNGEPQRLFGNRGQRVDIRFTLDGVEVSSGLTFEPTSEFTSTPLPTAQIDVGALIEAQTPTQTPGPSPTPTLTFTPSFTPPPTLTPSLTPIPSNTPTLTPTIGPSPTNTPTPTATLTTTPTLTFTPSDTPVPSLTPTPTAVLPLRVTPENQTPTKPGA